MQDEYFMLKALEQAKLASSYDEVPVGAVIVKNDEIIAVGSNFKERENCAVFHAEVVAIINACKKLDNWYLDGCTMYVTLEPCPMCCGAIINSRIDRLVYGAQDIKSGGVTSLYNILNDGKLNHKVDIQGGVLESECSSILTDFFKKKREEKK
ncbi:MAG: tRNA adenosine(34) deaminase TadA, partial [Clostridia bacterium]|nr:tRNA adenosine(34) deaminase TadA [Clostridia bacterium]